MVNFAGNTPRDVNPFAGKNMNLMPFIGQNILPMGGETPEQDPFCGEVPNDAQGYRAYRNFYESKMNAMLGGAKTMSIHINCSYMRPSGMEGSLHHNKPEHSGSGIVIACNHVIFQDPHNPEGVKFYPLARGSSAGYYLCKTCMRAEERHKLNYDRLSAKCSKCVLESLMSLTERFPDRFINLKAL